MNLRRLSQLTFSVILATLSAIVISQPASAAETVILKYSILRESISVPELTTLAQTGEASRSLKTYLRLANKQPEDLRNILNQSVDVDPVILSKVLNSFAGEYILERVSEVIHIPQQSSSRGALRGALVTSALADHNIRLIEVFENFPTSEVEVEGDRLAELYNQVKGVVDKLPQISL